MSKTFKIPNGILTLSESKAECPYCERKISFSEIEDTWINQESNHVKIKCKCKNLIGVTSNIKGDFVAYKL